MEKKSRVSARIETKLAETIDQQCKDLDITKQEFMVRAIVAELGRFDVRMVIQLITDDRDKMQAERDKARKDYQTASEWRNRYKAERNQAKMKPIRHVNSAMPSKRNMRIRKTVAR